MNNFKVGDTIWIEGNAVIIMKRKRSWQDLTYYLRDGDNHQENLIKL